MLKAVTDERGGEREGERQIEEESLKMAKFVLPPM